MLRRTEYMGDTVNVAQASVRDLSSFLMEGSLSITPSLEICHILLLRLLPRRFPGGERSSNRNPMIAQ